MKSNYPTHLSNTISNPVKNEQLIEIYHKNYVGLNSQESFRRSDKITFNNCQFVLYKDNIDTLQAVNQMCKHLRIQPKRISYAGTKDKRAKTCQLMSIFK